MSSSNAKILIGSAGSHPVSGAAYLFDAKTGKLLQKLVNPTLSDASFGSSVLISGDRMLIAAHMMI
jgi:hypothetical protein